ncbi:hypothetical protein RN001_012879 [Aquatica leii]|uniref:Uncharacterized protein n=1 Tax=Aquatica leii TaxID=1421715 RepID=A0AAN7PUW3_9COLE|nr:hypothetical protein RN001_012879 [Aquatica leii]
MKTIHIALVFVCVFNYAQSSMTEAQLKSAAKLLKNVCQPKTKITPAQLDNLHKGIFSTEPIVLSYMECVLRTGQIMKDGKLNYESLKSQMMNLPADRLEPGLITTENCKDSAKSTDKYMAAYEFYKCFYEDNPANFFLP